MKKNFNDIFIMSNKKAYFSIIFILSILLLSFYSKIILSPNEYLFTTNGDAIKNYYVFNSYINSNPSLTEFQQMNYPFYESILFIDSQPSLSIPIRIISKVFPSIAGYSIGIMNTLLILSFFFTAIFLYKIFQLLNINTIFSILAAIAITMLNPQVMRLNGHFSLAYSTFIPITIYLLLRIKLEQTHIKYLLYLSVCLLVSFFTHAYLGLICTLIVILYSFFLIFIQKKKSFPLMSIFKIFIYTIVPLLIFYFTSQLLDSHTGRTTNPWGIFFYHADLQTVFLPYSGILTGLRDWLFPQIVQRAEGVGYIGFATMLVLVIFILRLGYINIIKKPKNSTTHPLEFKIYILLASSIVLLFLSMMFPFRWGLEFLVDEIPLLKQFRSIGRFTWAFYFMATIFVVYLVNKTFMKLQVKNKVLAYALIIIFPAALFAESIGYHVQNSTEGTITKNLFLKENLSPDFVDLINSIPDKEYQAFIPVPFFLIGSENFELYREQYNSQFAMLFNYYTNIPMLANMSGRTSIDESKKIMQLFSSDFYEKDIQSYFPNKKPLLFLFQKNPVTSNEYNLLEKTTKIYENEEWYLGELNFDTIFVKSNKKEWEEFNNSKNSLYEKNGFLVSDTISYFEFIDFGESQPISFETNENSFEIDNKEYTLLGTIKKDDPKLWDKYFVRFWIYNQGKNYGQDMTKGLVFFDKSYDNSSHWLDPILKPGSSFEINKNWTLVELPLVITEPIADHLIIFNKPMKTEDKTYIKDLLIYKEGVKIYKEMEIDGEKYLFKNNHRIKLN